MLGNEKSDLEKIPEINWKAWCKSLALKKIHAKTVNANVVHINRNSLKEGKIVW